MQFNVEAEHGATTAATVEVVSFARTDGLQMEQLEIINRDGADEIYFVISSADDDPTNPTAKGDDTRVIPAVRGQSYKVNLAGKMTSVRVEMISTLAVEYSVIAELQ